MWVPHMFLAGRMSFHPVYFLTVFLPFLLVIFITRWFNNSPISFIQKHSQNWCIVYDIPRFYEISRLYRLEFNQDILDDDIWIVMICNARKAWRRVWFKAGNPARNPGAARTKTWPVRSKCSARPGEALLHLPDILMFLPREMWI